MQKLTLLFVAILFSALSANAQYGGPRLFLDIPVIYFNAPDVENIGKRLGVGAETAFNVGTHWSVLRVGGGAAVTADPNADDFGASIITTPYALLEAGAGMYRSNGSRCAKTHQNAFTAMGKVGMRYNFNNKIASETDTKGFIDYSIGVEFGHFFIRDIFKNYEVFLRSNYYTQSKTISADFGFKMFLNLRAGDR
ncbi:MAG: hypothetical protein IT259_07060 [Saprospiraceae bacterium]|nr:hypothetical protein [Saprospiraceae bacterium]